MIQTPPAPAPSLNLRATLQTVNNGEVMAALHALKSGAFFME
jgi:hypothetical protein